VTPTRYEFDAETHRYRIDGLPVPSVTQVLRDLVPGWSATEWHLQRGRAVHACAALIAAGKTFDADPQIAGQVEACHKWFREWQPAVGSAEVQVYNVAYAYAGTYDLLAYINGRLTLVDWKASLDARVAWQLAAYSAAMVDRVEVGVGVALQADGTYQTRSFKLAGYRREWFAMRAVFGIRERLNIKEAPERE